MRVKAPLYRCISLIRNCPPTGPYHRNMPRTLWRSQGGVQFLMSEVPLYSRCNTVESTPLVQGFLETDADASSWRCHEIGYGFLFQSMQGYFAQKKCQSIQGYLAQKKPPTLGPYSRPISRPPWWFFGSGDFISAR